MSTAIRPSSTSLKMYHVHVPRTQTGKVAKAAGKRVSYTPKVSGLHPRFLTHSRSLPHPRFLPQPRSLPHPRFLPQPRFLPHPRCQEEDHCHRAPVNWMKEISSCASLIKFGPRPCLALVIQSGLRRSSSFLLRKSKKVFV